MRRGFLRGLVTGLFLFGLSACGGDSNNSGQGASSVITDGNARFMVLSPTLIRLEYADNGQFEDRPTQTVINRSFPVTPFTTATENGELVIRTAALTLRYVQGSGLFTQDNLSIELQRGSETVTAQPDWSPGPKPGNLGGWRRGLDNEAGPVPLHDGLLSTEGWYLLNDSATVLLTDSAQGFEARPAPGGNYQDGYFFGYGLDYRQALADLRELTGPAPLLPRKALGVWFSKFWAYSAQEIQDLVAEFRTHQVPLDTFSVDTDWKIVHNPTGCLIYNQIVGARLTDPCSWNGWGWNPNQYPDPEAFVAWAHAEGLQLGLNIHPSISSIDPSFQQTQQRAGGLPIDDALPPCNLLSADINPCYVFDLANPDHMAAYFDLHAPIAASGIDFWWFDWCCEGTRAQAPGLTADTWINARYAEEHEAMGSRWPAFSRIGSSYQEGVGGAGNNGVGAFAEHRYTMHFTGDSCSTWPMLAFVAEMTTAEGNIGLPYVSHDIGSFLGEPRPGTGCNGVLGHTPHLPDDMYVRWIQLGTFQPIDRLHSHHGDRLPWEYPGQPQQIAEDFLRLRGRLVPFLYTLSRIAHDTGLPMARALYLQWPEHDAAYQYPSQFTLGDDMLVATVASPGDPASVELWMPPGDWIDYFTGEKLSGPSTVTREIPLDRYPVFMKAGSLLPTQPDLPTSTIGPQDNLIITYWPGADGHFDLYEDEGQGFGYRDGAYRRTAITGSSPANGCNAVTIQAAQGNFPGALDQRSWEVRFSGVDMPESVRVAGQPVVSGSGVPGWIYDQDNRTLSIRTGPRSAFSSTKVVARPGGC